MKLSPQCALELALLVLCLPACGASVSAAATRILATDEGVLRREPVCFVPPLPAPGLTERAQQARVQQVCEAAARAQHVSVIPYGSGRCLAATMSWESHATEDRDANCDIYGVSCHSTGVFAKTMRLTLAPAAGAAAVAETTASIRSPYNGFALQSLQALCSAAFEDYPKPLANSQFDVSVDKD